MEADPLAETAEEILATEVNEDEAPPLTSAVEAAAARREPDMHRPAVLDASSG